VTTSAASQSEHASMPDSVR